jgi:hypothetical protein
MELDRITHLFAAALMTIATVVVLGPGAPSILIQHAASQARLRRRHARRH